ncbi:MAG TPA: DbpA RNA binding domain-containing protein [Gemmatimonadaceae bacterium]|nr:DbpA RNA binding domain-containing protein [Gemmatimonadaceae bacterium]
MVEREASVGRTAQHAVHVLPHAEFAMARVLEPALDRITADADATQLLVITADTDTAVAMASVSRSLRDRSVAPLVAISAAGRGARLLGSRVVPAIAGSPGTLVALLRSSAVKLEGVRTVIIAWADELFEAREGEALEVVLAEIPKDARRIVVADHLTPDVEALIERHLRRASRSGLAAEESTTASLPIRYVSTTPAGRHAAFRRLLDDLDPPSVIVLASDPNSVEEARATVASLGFEGDASVRVEGAPIEEQAALVVFYDLPATAQEVIKVEATAPAQVVALVTPRQVPALRRLTAGAVEPLDISRAAAKARARDERVRSAIRAELQAGFPAREVMALEPLLSEFDGIEIAAAALRLFERNRSEEGSRRAEAERPVPRAAERSPERDDERRDARPRRTEGTRSAGEFTRVFISIGDRDGVRPGDLVGAITGESGITGDRIGKLDIRDGHSVAEIASSDAEAVIEKMNGLTIKGRRITARVDERPAPRPRDGSREGRHDSGGPRRSGPGDARRGGFREAGRGSREGTRGLGGDRSRDRGERGARGFGRDRDAGERRPRRDDDRPRGRGGFRDRSDEGRVPRAAREREEWSERGERVRNARRPRREES